MIILDLTNYKGKRPSHWPDSTPDKIRLTKGKHFSEYDVHPIERRKKWYKEMVKKQGKQYPSKNHDWPVGVSMFDLPAGVKIIET